MNTGTSIFTFSSSSGQKASVCVCLCTKAVLPGVPGLPVCIESSGGGAGGEAPTLTSPLGVLCV